jgi:hypothetical protein
MNGFSKFFSCVLIALIDFTFQISPLTDEAFFINQVLLHDNVAAKSAKLWFRRDVVSGIL